MDILSYAIASKQSRRIKRFIANPDSNSGILTTPSKIEAGEVITIPAGRTAILPDIVIEGEIIIEGDVFIPSGGSYNQVDVICDNVISKDKSVTIGTKQLVDTVREQDISGKKNFLNGLTTQGENITPYSGFKNLLINGAMEVWQRGTSFGNGVGYKADRWWTGNSARTITQHASDVPLGFNYCIHYSDGLYSAQIRQGIELSTVGKAGIFTIGKNFTLSFWVKSDLADTCEMGLYFGDSVDSNWTRAASITTDSIGPAWKRITKTFTITGSPLGTSRGLFITIETGGNKGIVKYTGLQLEEGSIATTFENRPVGLEFMLCQRYYQSFVINGGNGQLFSHERIMVTSPSILFVSKTIPFKVRMRGYPTITIPRVFINEVDNDAGWKVYSSGVANGMGGISIYKSISSVANSIMAFDAIADAEI